MDTEEGDRFSPSSLHKYLYTKADPVDGVDPTGHDDIAGMMTAMSMSVTLDMMLSSGTQLISNAKMYPVVVVSTGISTYTPWSQVKNQKQAQMAGLPVGMPIRIAVPDRIDPQAVVSQWRSSTSANFLTWARFAAFWSASENNYKVFDGAIYDAFGNFEYGATGAAAGFGLDDLLRAGQVLHGGTNNPINETDITSGFDAIIGGGTLEKSLMRLFP